MTSELNMETLLVDLKEGDTSAVRRAAALKLAKLQFSSEQILEALIAAIQSDSDGTVRQAARTALFSSVHQKYIDQLPRPARQKIEARIHAALHCQPRKAAPDTLQLSREIWKPKKVRPYNNRLHRKWKEKSYAAVAVGTVIIIGALTQGGTSGVAIKIAIILLLVGLFSIYWLHTQQSDYKQQRAAQKRLAANRKKFVPPPQFPARQNSEELANVTSRYVDLVNWPGGGDLVDSVVNDPARQSQLNQLVEEGYPPPQIIERMGAKPEKKVLSK